jgi:hypothetical protein
VSESGLEHEGTHEVVGDGLHPEFTLDDGRRKTAQDIEGETGFNLAVVQFDLPTLAVEFGQRLVGELLLVEERSGEDQMATAKPASVCANAH